MSIIELFSYPFLTRAFIVGTLVSLCASLLGGSLVLRRFSMIGDGLSHVGFASLALATVLGFAPLAVTVPVVALSAVLLLRISDKSRVGADSAIALISSSALAIGVFAISVVKGVNTDINNYLFGSIIAVSSSDAVFSVVLSIVVLFVYILLYNRIFAVTFDSAFAQATGVNTDFYTVLTAVLTALVIVLGMRILGSLLISALLIFPTITAMQVVKTYRKVTIFAAILSVVVFWGGLYLSYVISTPTGATIVIIHLLVFLITLAGTRIKRFVRR
jgi:ABC-type Mn2+/Zn2+ transport systems, permease components